MNHKRIYTILFFALFLSATSLQAAILQWFDGKHAVTYNVVGDASPVVQQALQMFESDIETVTGMAPCPATNATVEVYQLDLATSKTLRQLSDMDVLTSQLMDTQDAFYIGIHNDRIVIVGNNGRGCAYALLQLSRSAGVSPWVWWGDVMPETRKTLTYDDRGGQTECPSVVCRGIFINDEDWSMLQWAHKTVEPDSPQGTIGPKTYECLFQLMLRLKANTLWPAMHECTRAFFTVPGNREMAKRYDIILGSSHCEPLLRNGVGEWDQEERGEYNFITNRQSVVSYWQERLQEMKDQQALLTLGMRGIHDGPMLGVKTDEEKLSGLQDVIDTQRELIKRYYSNDVEKVPQVFIPYKEVLQIYEAGLRVPDDVTLMWCDDNYGYMTRLSDAVQQKREGGAGVYYHLSYWGRPHDYLWLTTTQPGLIYNELRTAYDHGANRVWIINVHDPKVAAYHLSLAMDMAWNINSVSPTTLRKHLNAWLAEQFGQPIADAIHPAMERFYYLAAVRRPEFMGFTQVELDKKKYVRGLSLPNGTAFSETEFGDELDRYLEAYDDICDVVNKQTPSNADAYFAHVLYPINAAAAMAHKHLNAQQGDTVTAMVYQQRITDMTRKYNTMCGGKWNGLMNAAPRDLPVFRDYQTDDSTTVRITHSKDLDKLKMDDVVVQNAAQLTSTTDDVQPIEMLGHSMMAVSIPRGTSVSYTFTSQQSGQAVLRMALIPTQANDKGDIRFSVSIDGEQPTVVSLKEKYRSEGWKQNVLRGQAVKNIDINIASGSHTLTVAALDDHIILDQWMLDFDRNRSFYMFPIAPMLY